MKVLVFTSVESDLMIAVLAPGLNALAGAGQWNFDLDDCDRILRVTSSVNASAVSFLLGENGIFCSELEDIVPETWEFSAKLASQ